MRQVASAIAPLLPLLLLSLSSGPLGAAEAPSREASTPGARSERSLVVISDLHMGQGRDAEEAWHPTEDFRWPKALEGFLGAVASEGPSGVDLLIAGDFLELWQPPASVACAGPPSNRDDVRSSSGTGNYGCTIGELITVTKAVVAAHARELAALSRFASKNGNCIVIIPGNHDAGLTLDVVWEPVRQALSADDGCIERADNGIWRSADGRVVVEHGHQIGPDANKYPDWPRLTRRFGSQEYVWQPWGEAFVQAIFNLEETSFPLIDNLSPSSAGVRYRMAERGLTGSAADVAAFLRFNLFDTSLRQKVQILGEEEVDEPKRWDLAKARDLGHLLFAGALGTDDPFATALRSGEDADWQRLRAELDELTRTLPENEISRLCDQLAIRGGPESCGRSILGHGIGKLFLSRERELRIHLAERKQNHRRLRTFVYGHTHSFELPWDLRADQVTSFRVANSGAFQRLIDDEQLRELARKAGISGGEYLRRHSLEDLPACYTSVHLSSNGDLEVRAWHMPEDAPAGGFVDPCTAPCARVGHGCPEGGSNAPRDEE